MTKIFGIVGWKDTGKTGLVVRLVQYFGERGVAVSTIKHAHHDFDVDQPGRDSYRHRAAGAREVLVASARRYALMHEVRDGPEPRLRDLVARLAPVPLVLVEGYKSEPHPKIEVWRKGTPAPPIAVQDPSVVAVATDRAADLGVPCAVLDLDDTAAIAAFIAKQLGLKITR